MIRFLSANVSLFYVNYKVVGPGLEDSKICLRYYSGSFLLSSPPPVTTGVKDTREETAKSRSLFIFVASRFFFLPWIILAGDDTRYTAKWWTKYFKPIKFLISH